MNLEIPTELPAIPEPPDLKKYLGILIVLFAVNALIVAALAIIFQPMVAAKCLFIELAGGAGLLCVAIFFLRGDIYHLLSTLETLAEDGRDETVVQMRLGRAHLHEISQKLTDTLHPPQHEDAMANFIQHAMPVVQILISKEKNWLQLGMFGWRLAQDAMRVMKQTRNT